MKKFLQKGVDVKFKQAEFSQETLKAGLNALSYGTFVNKHLKKDNKKSHQRFFYILEDDTRFLQWISSSKQFTKSRIHLGDVKDFSTEVHWKGKNKEENQGHFLRIQTNLDELVLEFQTANERDSFYAGVQHFAINSIQKDFLEKRQDQVKHLATNLFLNADKDGSKQLSIEETKRLLQELHINIDRKYLTKLFEKYDVNKNGEIDQNEFLNVITDISRKEELAQVFKKYCAEYIANSNDQQPIMTIAQFQLFQRNEQHQIFSTQEIADLFSFLSMKPTKDPKTQQICERNRRESTVFSKDTLKNLKISFYEFSNFIFSQENTIFDPQTEELHQNMDLPLSDYFVNSSHNTYLMANQLTSDSSCQAYINAFLNGCRCVEIDCWDGENGEPIVYHGHTLTSKIFFKDVVQTINEYAFRISLFPVVISFENHCSHEQTLKMAVYLKEIFQDKLLIVPSDYQDFEYYLSPNQLQEKIIVKSKGSVEKAVNEDLEMGYISESDEDEETESQSDLAIYEDIKNIIPDFTQNEQFVKNLENGKKKSIFLQKDTDEQKHILQMISSKQQSEQERALHSMKNSQNYYNNNNFQNGLCESAMIMGGSNLPVLKSQGSLVKSLVPDGVFSEGEEEYHDNPKEIFSERAQDKVLEHLNHAQFTEANRHRDNSEEKPNEKYQIIQNLESFNNLSDRGVDLKNSANQQEQSVHGEQDIKPEPVIKILGGESFLMRDNYNEINIEVLQREHRKAQEKQKTEQEEYEENLKYFQKKPEVFSRSDTQVLSTLGDVESLEEYPPETPMLSMENLNPEKIQFLKNPEKNIVEGNSKVDSQKLGLNNGTLVDNNNNLEKDDKNKFRKSQSGENGLLAAIMKKTESHILKNESFLLPPPLDYPGNTKTNHKNAGNTQDNSPSGLAVPISGFPSQAPGKLSSRNTMNPTGNGFSSKGTLKSRVTLRKKETFAKNQTLKNQEDDDQNPEGKKKSSNKKKNKECKEFLQATGLFGCHVNLKNPKKTCWEISSISEIKYHRLLRSHPKELVELLKKSFIRLYPSAMRVDSSNFDPIKGFLSGCQFVALNFQTCDLPMLLNQSLFQQNGGVRSGYLLKPNFMLHNAKKTFVPSLMRKVIKIVKIKIISGQQLRPENFENDTFDVVDPYVQLFIKGTDFDERNNKPQLTRIISDNGFHPIWDSDTYTFNFACPELAMLVFRVLDSDVGADTHLGSFAVPVDVLRPGYRIIPLRKMADLQLIEHSYLLVKIDITEKIIRPILRKNKVKK